MEGIQGTRSLTQVWGLRILGNTSHKDNGGKLKAPLSFWSKRALFGASGHVPWGWSVFFPAGVDLSEPPPSGSPPFPRKAVKGSTHTESLAAWVSNPGSTFRIHPIPLGLCVLSLVLNKVTREPSSFICTCVGPWAKPTESSRLGARHRGLPCCSCYLIMGPGVEGKFHPDRLVLFSHSASVREDVISRCGHQLPHHIRCQEGQGFY